MLKDTKIDIVWYLHETKKIGISPKLQTVYDKPFVVIKTLGDVNYRIQMNKEGKTKVVHHNKLKPYEGREPPKWAKSAVRKAQKKAPIPKPTSVQ